MRRMRVCGAMTAIAATTTGVPVQAQQKLDPSGGPSAAYVLQIGDAQSATVRQNASQGQSIIRQEGSGNNAKISTAGSARTTAAIDQSGSGNRASAVQAGSGELSLAIVQQGAYNKASAEQRGSGGVNVAYMVQSGSYNTMDLTQTGEDNAAKMEQTGDRNAMNASQQGNRNSLTWQQTGNDLDHLKVTQHNGAAATIVQR